MAPALELLEKPIESLPAKAISSIRNGLSAETEDSVSLEPPEKHERVMSVFRALIADICQQFGEGHAG